jgi:hypothetical protein
MVLHRPVELARITGHGFGAHGPGSIPILSFTASLTMIAQTVSHWRVIEQLDGEAKKGYIMRAAPHT